MLTHEEIVQWNATPLQEKLRKLLSDMQGLPAWSPLESGIRYVPCGCGIQLGWLNEFATASEAKQAGIDWCNEQLEKNNEYL